MEGVKTFIVTLVSTMIFITAVELVAPDNSFKKYLKFILGLILVAVILTPIINVFTKGEEEISILIDKFSNTKDTMGKITDEGKEKNTLQEKVFKENLEKNINEMLINNFRDTTFKTTIDVSITITGEVKVDIKKVFVCMEDGSVKKVEKITIGKVAKEERAELTEKEKKVRAYLKEELKINESKIIINNKG